MTSATAALFDRLFDYAGLYPPAALSMERAVRAYAEHRLGAEREVVHRLVVGAGRLAELGACLGALPAALAGPEPWPLAVLAGSDLTGDVAAVAAFAVSPAGARARIETLEAKAATPEAVAAARAAVPRAYGLVLELPLGGDPLGLAHAVGEARAVAKVRTGGVRAEDIPAPATVLGFLVACAGAGVPFKATAGLHHAVRGPQDLTYEPGCARATLFGYLNVLMAALALRHGRGAAEAGRALEEEDRGAFALGEDAVGWRDLRFSAAEVRAARSDFLTAIGSCSVAEPVAEMRELGARLGVRA